MTVKSTHVAILERHGSKDREAIMVPPGQSLAMDKDTATRKWLWPYLGKAGDASEWHLVEFVKIRPTP